MATPTALPAPAPTGTTIALHGDLAVVVAPDGPSATTITATDAAGATLGVLARVATSPDARASATLIAAALAIAAERAGALWPAAS